MVEKISITGLSLSGEWSNLDILPSNNLCFFLHLNSERPKELPFNPRSFKIKNHSIQFDKLMVVEHFLSTLYGLCLPKICVNFYCKELPFFDGSSLEFFQNLRQFKNPNYEIMKIEKEVILEEDGNFLKYLPINTNGLIIEMHLEHPFIGTQKIELNINSEVYEKEIAPARTFVFTDEDDPRIKKLPSYGIGITEKGIYSAMPLRFDDEPVRHKVLDLLGDLFILQKMLIGKIIAKNTSHRLNHRFVKKILKYRKSI